MVKITFSMVLCYNMLKKLCYFNIKLSNIIDERVFVFYNDKIILSNYL